MAEVRQVQRECPACGAIYVADAVRLRHGRQTTCSRACSYAQRANERRNGSSFTCPVCGDEFTRTPSKIKSKHETLYCSPVCQYAGRGLGLTKRVVTKPYVRVAPYSSEPALRAWETRRRNGSDRHSDDTKARLSETTARAIAEGRIDRVSKLEDVVAVVLDDTGIGYRRQVGVRGARGRYVCCLDFLLADGRALEVNGTFFHADPRAYPEGPVSPVQIRNAAAWERKVCALAERAIPLLVVWEADIRKNSAQAVAVALSAV